MLVTLKNHAFWCLFCPNFILGSAFSKKRRSRAQGGGGAEGEDEGENERDDAGAEVEQSAANAAHRAQIGARLRSSVILTMIE